MIFRIVEFLFYLFVLNVNIWAVIAVDVGLIIFNCFMYQSNWVQFIFYCYSLFFFVRFTYNIIARNTLYPMSVLILINIIMNFILKCSYWSTFQVTAIYNNWHVCLYMFIIKYKWNANNCATEHTTFSFNMFNVLLSL